MSGVMFETAIAIYDKLTSTCLKFPASAEEWKAIAGGFWEKWHFPNCLGAIDGKHFKVHCPRNTGSQYFNYKQQFSSLVLAMCDSNYIFTYIESGSAGREGDAGVFSHSALYAGLESRLVKVPEPS
ncbi:hypothetical protein BOX15_Mlig028800g1 [Macrostomum lignano]|uniref:DDE Tnp4 domain-containing protein n=1 Tax=Macrostomum lignano TaxID=282301 RepID=A0A267E2G9_9PLAT|nr:hypothetical protein BOX15_Mlig028800g1 [Macrostomum lignano]